MIPLCWTELINISEKLFPYGPINYGHMKKKNINCLLQGVNGEILVLINRAWRIICSILNSVYFTADPEDDFGVTISSMPVTISKPQHYLAVKLP